MEHSSPIVADVCFVRPSVVAAFLPPFSVPALRVIFVLFSSFSKCLLQSFFRRNNQPPPPLPQWWLLSILFSPTPSPPRSGPPKIQANTPPVSAPFSSRCFFPNLSLPACHRRSALPGRPLVMTIPFTPPSGVFTPLSSESKTNLTSLGPAPLFLVSGTLNGRLFLFFYPPETPRFFFQSFLFPPFLSSGQFRLSFSLMELYPFFFFEFYFSPPFLLFLDVPQKNPTLLSPHFPPSIPHRPAWLLYLLPPCRRTLQSLLHFPASSAPFSLRSPS